MGNAEAHRSTSPQDNHESELDLSQTLSYKQYCRHVEGRPNKSSLEELPWNSKDTLSLYERLDASFNLITELPSDLPFRLPHLNHLDLSHNQLYTLPENIGLLLQLETFLLRYNKIKVLPDSLFRLVKLKKLDLCHNQLRILQDDCVHFKKLEKLDVSHNNLKVLPSSLGGIRTLKVLLASNNRLCEPLDSVCECGSDELLSLLRKTYNLSGHYSDHAALTNQIPVFPRVRGNHLQTSVVNPQSAQMQYIQSQTHTSNTRSRIKSPLLPPAGGSKLEALVLRDKILGLIYGAAIGDALGIATCSMSADECRFHYNQDSLHYKDILRDEVRVRWKQGDWTANFDTLVLLLESILGWGGVLDELEYAKRLHKWCFHGYTELGDEAGIVLSETVKQVIEHSEFLRNPHTAAEDVLHKSGVHVYKLEHSPSLSNGDDGLFSDDSEDSMEVQDHGPLFPSSHPCIPAAKFGTDNGALVSIPILGVAFFYHSEEVELNTVRICKTTHSHPLCVAAAVMVTNIVSQILQGGHDLQCNKSVEEIISRAVTMATKHLNEADHLQEFNRYVNLTSLVSVDMREEYNMAYVLKALSAALLALRSQQSFKTFMMSLFHEGGDSNSNGCIAGALLGCKIGYSKLPPDWLTGLRSEQTEWLNVKINHLLDMIGLP